MARLVLDSLGIASDAAIRLERPEPETRRSGSASQWSR
jgi:hypothetical protein